MITKIYLVTNIDNNPFKVYIGKTKGSRKNNHELTYGKQITYDYIDEVNSLKYEDWEPLETFYINYFKFLGFEVINKRKKGGSGPEEWSPELLNSEGNKLRKEKIKNNKERAKKISQATKGVPLTEERKEKLRGPRPHLVGKKKKGWSDEAKAKQSIVLKGREAPWMKGKKLTEEQKQNLSEKMKGRPSSMLGKERPDLKGKPSLNSKPVLQYDLKGNFIKEWNSATEAAHSLNIKHSVCISRCCQDKNQTAHGFLWEFKISNNIPLNINPIKNINKKRKPINQYDKQGNFIKEYKSLTEASKLLNIKVPNISACLLGRIQWIGEYTFKYKDE